MPVHSTKFKTKTQALAYPAPSATPFKEYWHDSARGFGIRIMRADKSGRVRKSWLARYDVIERADGQETKKDKKEVLGLVEDMPYEQAFDLARTKMREGAASRRAPEKPKHRITLGEAYDAYILANETALSPRTLADYKKRFTSHLLAYRDEPLEDLNTAWWQALYKAKKVSAEALRKEGKLVGRKGDGVVYLEGLVTGLVRAIYNHQIELGRAAKTLPADAITHNPVIAFAKKAEKRDPKSTIIPVKRIGDLIQIAQNELHPKPRDVFMCMLLLGWRSTLIYEMRFDRFNAKERTYFVKKQDCGNKLAKDWDYPLPDYICDRIFLPRLAAQKTGWVFPSDVGGSGHYSSIHTSLKSLMAKAKLSEETGKSEDDHLNPHKIRRTYVTIMNGVVPNAIIAKRLAVHSINASPSDSQMTGNYLVSDTDSLRPWVNKTAAAILGSTANYTKFGAISLGEIEESEELERLRDELVGTA